MTANKLEKRIVKLEQIITPQTRRKSVQVIQSVGVTREKALLKAGISPEKRDEFNIFLIEIVETPVRSFISGNN